MSGIRRYCHVGTGNYNPVTARIYEDVGILSADPDLGADLTHLFNHLTGYGREHAYRKLLVAPAQLRPALLRMIRREAEAQRTGGSSSRPTAWSTRRSSTRSTRRPRPA